MRAIARRAATEAGLEASARLCAREQMRLGQAAFIGEFARAHPYVPGVRIADQDTATVGAYHTADIPYFFGTLDAFNLIRPTRSWTPWDRELSAKMMRSLIAMAATGSPDTAGMPWPSWTPKAERKIILGDAITSVTLDRRKLDWFASHPAVFQPAPRRARPID